MGQKRIGGSVKSKIDQNRPKVKNGFFSHFSPFSYEIIFAVVATGAFPSGAMESRDAESQGKKIFFKKTQNRPFLGQKRIGHFQNRQNRRKIDENRTNIDTDFLSFF